MADLTPVSMTIGGLSLLIASENKLAGHIAMINPSPDHLLASDRVFSNKHLPLLVFRKMDIFDIEGQAIPFKLNGSILPEFLDDKSLDDYVGYSVQGSVITVADASLQDDKRPLRLVKTSIDRFLDANGCRRTIKNEKKKNDWSSIEWTASLNTIFPGLRLAPEWIDSPHVGARLALGSGTVSATHPVVTESGHLKVNFYGTKGPRVFTDAFLYEVDLAKPTVLVDGRENRWRVILSRSRTPIKIWLLSLDDHFSPTRPSLTDHFYLYSLLPWRFRAPSYGSCANTETRGGCITANYIQMPPHNDSGTPTSASTNAAAAKAVRAKKSRNAKKRPARKRGARSS
jgi:hypothetical protein